jgi:hypothetical protein
MYSSTHCQVVGVTGNFINRLKHHGKVPNLRLTQNIQIKHIHYSTYGSFVRLHMKTGKQQQQLLLPSMAIKY